MTTNLRMAMRALTQNKLQALLTLLGMSVGIAMVVIVSGLGRGALLKIESQIEAAGPTRIVIRSGNFTPSAIDSSGEQDAGGGEPGEGAFSATPGTGGDVALADVSNDAAAMEARRRIRAVKKTHFRSPPTPLGAPEMALLRGGVADVRAVAGKVEGNVSLDAGAPVHVLRFSGFEPARPDMTDWKLAEGRWIGADEHASGAPVMMVTSAVGRQLWPNLASPLGQIVAAGGRKIAVVGVIEVGGEGAPDVVPTVYVPVGLAQALLGRSSYDTITVRTISVGVTAAVAKDLRGKLRALHHLPADMVDDFRAETQSVSAMPGMGSDPRLARAVHSNTAGFEQASWEQMAKSMRQAGRTFTLLLAGAAAVSLLVGGIGIMNIMLVSVSARTREIGLRMALGARAGDVMAQFLVEAVTLAALGGLIGLLLGMAGLMVTQYGLHWAAASSPAMLAAALAMAAVTGVVFGFVPARRAAFLDPVIALRSE
ncbi:MAG TPA: ABC transporter permease [Rhizomicrobium sp.]